MSDSVRPHRQKPTRRPRPWDSPGKKTGVGCHYLLQGINVKSEREVTWSCLTLSNPMDYSLPGSSIREIFQARVLEWGAIAFSVEILLLSWSFVSYTKWQPYSWMQRSLHFVDGTFPCTKDFHVNVIKLIFSLMICPFSSCLRNSSLSWENKYRLLHILH